MHTLQNHIASCSYWSIERPKFASSCGLSECSPTNIKHIPHYSSSQLLITAAIYQLYFVYRSLFWACPRNSTSDSSFSQNPGIPKLCANELLTLMNWTQSSHAQKHSEFLPFEASICMNYCSGFAPYKSRYMLWINIHLYTTYTNVWAYTYRQRVGSSMGISIYTPKVKCLGQLTFKACASKFISVQNARSKLSELGERVMSWEVQGTSISMDPVSMDWVLGSPMCASSRAQQRSQISIHLWPLPGSFSVWV